MKNLKINKIHRLTTGTVAFGFFDFYRNYYNLPAGFEKKNTTGFTPLYAKIEYGLTDKVTVAATLGHDEFQYNFGQVFKSNGSTFERYRTDNFSLWCGGITAFYYFDNLLHVKHTDFFAGIGFSINNTQYSAFPQYDSSVAKKEHLVTPYIKFGGHYWLTEWSGLFFDFGYDRQSIFAIGFSCKFYKKNGKHLRF